MEKRYKACMILSGVGDAMGYKNGHWEFNKDGKQIHEELEKMGGLDSLEIKLPAFCVSDDTVMHIATAKALVKPCSAEPHRTELYHEIARQYIKCMKLMDGRAPGITSQGSVSRLRPGEDNGYMIPFNGSGGGCGAAMRAMCIGLRYHRPEQLADLIRVSIESGRMTHHHPTGYLGSLAAALFTAYAVQDKSIEAWGPCMLDVVEQAREYVRNSGHYVDENLERWGYFVTQWEAYIKLRGLTTAGDAPKFTDEGSIEFRDKLYTDWSFNGWGGASGHDSVMIAYDALLGCGGSWSEFCLRGVLHGGDNDSTGAIGAAWYGAVYGMDSVPKQHHKKLEFREKIKKLAHKLYTMSH